MKILETLKIGRVAGPDAIENKTLKMMARAIAPFIAKLFTDFMREQSIPKQWMLTEIILLHKKEDRKDLNNYRPKSPTSNISKIFCKLIKNRIYPTLDGHQSKDQAGFRKGFSTVDHLFTVNQIIEKARE